MTKHHRLSFVAGVPLAPAPAFEEDATSILDRLAVRAHAADVLRQRLVERILAHELVDAVRRVLHLLRRQHRLERQIALIAITLDHL